MVTTVVKKVQAVGGLPDYTSLVLWEAGQRGDITAAGNDTIQIAEIYGGGSVGGCALSSAFWTTDATHYPWIRAATGQGHSGIWSSAKAYINAEVAGVGGINVGVGYTRIGPGISTLGDGVYGASDYYDIEIKSATISGPVIIDGIISKAAPAGSFSFGVVASSVSVTHILRNCVTYNQGGGLHPVRIDTNSGRLLVYNCTLITNRNCFYGAPTGVITSQNNYLACGGAIYAVSGTMNKGDHDATANTEAVTPALRSIAHSTANFIDVTAATADYHLQPTSALRMKGTPLADVLTDFEGDNRVGLIYDIGADQQSDVPVCWNYTAQYRNSSRLFKASGCGCFPRNLRVPGNVDTNTGRMVDDGVEIDPDEYTVEG